ncbi:MAG: fimbrillin family protein [Muribaculum sp.]|nr:fimbrillin family protein [Muribaculum sp.]
MNLQKNILTKVFYTILLTLSLSACSDEAIFNHQHGEGHISFLVDDVAESGMTRSAAEDVIYPMYGMSVTGKDSLYFHTDVSNYQTLSNYMETRGVVINSTNIDKVAKNILVDAFVKGNTPYMVKYPISKNGNIWSGSDTRYWPSDKSEQIEFYASAMIPDNMNLTCTNGSITTSYSVPHSENSNTDAEAQPDILLGYSKCSYNDVAAKHEGNVPLKLRHALAAVSFNVGDFRKGKIKTITIRNARKSGALTYSEIENVEKSTPVMNWTLDEGLTNFTQTFDIDVEDGKPTEITSQKPSATFMLLPQDIESDNVEFEVELECEENNNTVTKRLVASAYSAGNISQWEAGKHYTYTLSSSSINWTYLFEIDKNELSFVEGEQSGNCVVKSYRQRTGNPTVKEPIGWYVVAGTATDKGFDDGFNVVRDPENWIESLMSEGKGSVTGETWNVTVSPNRLLSSSYPGDTKLKEKGPRGTTDNPWDLSTHDYVGGVVPRSTANCYVVNSAGTYCFPTVYGNSYTNGIINSDSYKYAKYITTKPEIENIDNATILWMDGLGLISDVKYDKVNKRVIFSIDTDHIQQGNATIGVRDGKNNILWSWHIWVYDYSYDKGIYEDCTEIDDYDNSSTKYVLMNNNLGFCNSKTVTYAERNGNVTFTQAISGNTVTLPLTLKEFKVTTQDHNSATYQWGRKDPFMGVDNISECVTNPYGKKYKPLYPKSSEYLVSEQSPNMLGHGTFSIKQSIEKPNEIAFGSTGTSWMSEIDNNAWNSLDKTIFDPSPVGFRMPGHEVFKIFSVGGENHPNKKETEELDKLHSEDINKYTEEYKSEHKHEYSDTNKLNSDANNYAKEIADKNKATNRLNMFDGWLNGIRTGPDSFYNNYVFYTGKNKTGKKIELTSTGRRPLSGTTTDFNNFFLWTADGNKNSTDSNYSCIFKLGKDGEVKIEPEGTSAHCEVYPVRPIKDVK